MYLLGNNVLQLPSPVLRSHGSCPGSMGSTHLSLHTKLQADGCASKHFRLSPGILGQLLQTHEQPLGQGGNIPGPLLGGNPSPCCICYLPPFPVHYIHLLSPVCEGNLGTWNMVFPEP